MAKNRVIHEIARRMYIKGDNMTTIARRTGLSLITVSDVFTCKRLPSPANAELLADALGMEPVELRAILFDAQRTA